MGRASKKSTKSKNRANNLRWRKALVEKDNVVFGELLKSLVPTIRKIAFLPAKGNLDAQDAFEEAVGRAKEKVWLKFIELDPREAQLITYPWAYFRAVAHNAIYDYFRTKEKVLWPNSFREQLLRADEMFPRKRDDEDTGGHGWQAYQVKEKPLRKGEVAFGHSQHPLLNRLPRYLFDPDISFTVQSRGVGVRRRDQIQLGEAVMRFKDNAKQVPLLVATVPGEVDRLILSEALLGYRNNVIAKRFDKQESHISRARKTWFTTKWHLTTDDVWGASLGILLHNLVDIHQEVKKETEKRLFPLPRPGWPFGDSTRRDNADKRYNTYLELLHGAITTDHRTVAWFGDLQEADTPALSYFIDKLVYQGWGKSQDEEDTEFELGPPKEDWPPKL